jgi:tetratricopeptide (TPR) repeat protein
MSTEQINRLHEQASERYLNGDYKGAIEAWRDVLGLDAANEQALEGVQLASQFVEPAPEVQVQGTPEVEHDLDQGLRVLDGLRATTLLHADVADGAVDRKPSPPQGDGALAVEEFLEGWEPPAKPSPEAQSFGLEPVAGSSPAGSAPLSAAASELKRRVDDLLAEAKAKAAAGEREEALAILSRLAILDEENAEAAALRSKIEAESASDLDKIELAIIEGVAALEADNLDEAERCLNAALALAPDHREARHYLEKVAERRASGGEDLLGTGHGESAPQDGAVERATGAEALPPPATPAAFKPIRPAAAAAEPPELPPAQGSRPIALPPPKFLVFGAIGAAALISAAIALPRLFGGSTPKPEPPRLAAANSPAGTVQPPAPAGAGPARRPARAASAGSNPSAGASPAAPVAPANPEELAKSVATSLATARSRMNGEDFGGAVVAFNEALTLDPANAEAKAGIADAGERYKASKAERDALNSIKLAFRDEEFSSGLRLAYRLPPTVSASYIETIKVVGWYNLAVVALRAGDCREALSHLGEALEVSPADTESKKLKEFASRYVDAVKDRVFLDHVEALAFRTLPPS